MRLRRLAPACLLFSGFAGLALAGDPAPGATAVPLKNAGFEDPFAAGARCASGWSCKMHANPDAFRFFADPASPSGKGQSLCVEPASKEPWAMVSQPFQDGPIRELGLAGARLRFSIAIRLEGVTGRGAGPFVIAQGGHGQVIAHAQQLAQGSAEWQRLETELQVPDSASVVEVGLVLNYPGKACIDDARLEIVQRSKSPV
jgi:hypothetical protein